MGDTISSLVGNTINSLQEPTPITPIDIMEDPQINNLPNKIIQIYNYMNNDFVEYIYSPDILCEYVCLNICRELNISPITRILFALRHYDAPADSNEWAVLGQPLNPKMRYAFRIRFKVPDLHSQLKSLDTNTFEYLYRQIRADVVREYIPEIRYPIKKDYVMGLGVVDMYVDLQERRDSENNIKANYQHYLPQQLVRKHWLFCKQQIRRSFPRLIEQHFSLQYVKEQYVLGVHKLAPNYLMETYTAFVDNLESSEQIDDNCNPTENAASRVRIKLDPYDSPEPGLKVAKCTFTENLEVI